MSLHGFGRDLTGGVHNDICMRALWKGNLSVGLVNIPVKLYAASRQRRLNFDLLRKSDLCRVGYLRVCKSTGEEVSSGQITRGYKFGRSSYVLLSQTDQKKADLKKTQTIEVLHFTDEEQISPNYFKQPFYLGPEKGSESMYALLREAMHIAGKVGIVNFVLKGKEYLGMLRTEDNFIMLNQLRYQSEIKPAKEIDISKKDKFSQEELMLMINLVDRWTATFAPEEYKDTYIEALKETISQKIDGKANTRPNEELKPTKLKELKTKLRESLKKSVNSKTFRLD